MVADLKEPWEHIGWLAPDDKKARVEFPKVGVQIFQTLEEKPGERGDREEEEEH